MVTRRYGRRKRFTACNAFTDRAARPSTWSVSRMWTSAVEAEPVLGDHAKLFFVAFGSRRAFDAAIRAGEVIAINMFVVGR